jgi:hypothetical protein
MFHTSNYNLEFKSEALFIMSQFIISTQTMGY